MPANSNLWRASANRDALVARQRLYAQIRAFFSARDVLEVETPLLCQAPVCDANIEPFAVPVAGAATRYLHTSPEYAMKRLLCDGVGDIFQICKVFRQGESGARHNPEFSMLEWYRVGFDHHQLMAEVAELMQVLLAPLANQPSYSQPLSCQTWPIEHLTYRKAMQMHAGLDPWHADDDQVRAKGIELSGHDLALTRDGWLDVIMSHGVEPRLPRDTLVFIHDYPASQAALAKIAHRDGAAVAERFELYFNGVELANGYHELTFADEQRARFVAEAGDPAQLDEHLLAAMAHGLPDCAGVAMGLDRLLMLMAATDIGETLAFAWPRA